MKIRNSSLILPAIALVMLVFSIIQVVRAQQRPPQPQPPIEPPRTIFGKTVAGAGIVEARTENISIGAAVPGLVIQVYVPVEKVGVSVKKGDPLCLIDDRQLKAQLQLQLANLSASEAQLAKLKAQPRKEEIPPLEAALEAADYNLKVQDDTAKRNAELYPQNAVPGRDYLQSQYLARQALHQKAQAKANLDLLKAGAWKYDIDIAAANVEVARAQVNQTKTDLERLVVRATVDGEVLQINVRQGEYVGAPPTTALYVLGNTKPMNIRVDIDEYDIPRAYRYFKPGVPAYVSPRGDPSMKVPVTFDRVEPYVVPKKSLTGDNTERVDTRVLQVIYRVADNQPVLYVGMQVDVFLDADSKDDTAAKGQVQR